MDRVPSRPPGRSADRGHRLLPEVCGARVRTRRAAFLARSVVAARNYERGPAGADATLASAASVYPAVIGAGLRASLAVTFSAHRRRPSESRVVAGVTGGLASPMRPAEIGVAHSSGLAVPDGAHCVGSSVLPRHR